MSHLLKTCVVCEVEKETVDFYKCAAKKEGLSYKCKSCDNKARLSWTKANPERHKKSLRNRMLKSRYGISLKEYNTMCEQQEHKCAICGCTKENNNGGIHHLAVDHCHTTGAIRGILCSNCNRGLGLLGDNIESVRKAMAYLEKHNDTTQENENNRKSA